MLRTSSRVRILRLSGCALALALALAACQSPSRQTTLAARVAAQNDLLEEEYQFDLKEHPQLATEQGDYRYNDQLDALSLAAADRQQRANQDFLSRLQAISTAGFSEQDQLSHDLMQQVLQQRLEDYQFKDYEMPVSQNRGPQITLTDLPLAVPLDSVQHYEDYLARLRQIPQALAQTEEVLRAGMRDHLMPVRFLLEKVPVACQGIIDSDPFLLPTRHYPDSVPAEEQQRLTQAITQTVTTQVLPAYTQFGRFIATEYAPQGRTTLSATSLPGGEARYLHDIRHHTTVSNLTPAQIHAIGLREIARIEAEMLALAKSQGFADLDSFRKALHSNPKYTPTSSEQIVDDFRHYIDQMRPRLPELFEHIPNSPVTVEAIPPFESGSATHYNVGTPDGKRPGRVVVATSDFAHRSLLNDEAIAYHEGIPGHHMQLSVAMQLTSLPKFRRHLESSGYVEGWALYAERLGKEIGFYQDPGSDYGRLASELHRAVRLVVDTGIHSMGWSREQVVEFFRESQAIDEPSIQSETDRYIAWPGQALAYKLGQLKILELRERARSALGARFDIRRFNDAIIDDGVLSLYLLQTHMEHWISAEQQRH